MRTSRPAAVLFLREALAASEEQESGSAAYARRDQPGRRVDVCGASIERARLAIAREAATSAPYALAVSGPCASPDLVTFTANSP
jgi:hypothetical protein